MTQRRRRRSTSQNQALDIFGSAISNMPDRYLECRDLKHNWVVTQDYRLVDATREEGVEPRLGHMSYIRRLLACSRCGKRRNDACVVADRGGWETLERLNSTYVDPEGYGVKGVGHMSGTGDMIRGEVYKRAMQGIHIEE